MSSPGNKRLRYFFWADASLKLSQIQVNLGNWRKLERMILAINQVGGYLNKTLHELKVARKKISADIEAEVMFKSNLLCCVDQKEETRYII